MECTRQVALDFLNFAETGLGVESFHFATISMWDIGFQKRQDTLGDNILVVLRAPPNFDYRKKTLEVWTACGRSGRFTSNRSCKCTNHAARLAQRENSKLFHGVFRFRYFDIKKIRLNNFSEIRS